MSRHTRKTWTIFSNIYFFGFSILLLLSEKLADEIDLDLFSVFTEYSVSFLWVDLDLSNDLDLYNDIPLSDLLLMGLFF